MFNWIHLFCKLTSSVHSLVLGESLTLPWRNIILILWLSSLDYDRINGGLLGLAPNPELESSGKESKKGAHGIQDPVLSRLRQTPIVSPQKEWKQEGKQELKS